MRSWSRLLPGNERMWSVVARLGDVCSKVATLSFWSQIRKRGFVRTRKGDWVTRVPTLLTGMGMEDGRLEILGCLGLWIETSSQTRNAVALLRQHRSEGGIRYKRRRSSQPFLSRGSK